LCDNVILGSGAQILGPITIGSRARVGANAVVTEDVPEGATMVGLKARSTLVPVETWLKDFIPDGTPCKEPCEPTGGSRVDELEAEVALLKAQVAAVLAAQGENTDAPAPVGGGARRRSRG
jgi:serine O-acetyltransferase